LGGPLGLTGRPVGRFLDETRPRNWKNGLTRESLKLGRPEDPSCYAQQIRREMAAEAKQIETFESFWAGSLVKSFWFVLERWHEQFQIADDTRLIGRSISRECYRNDIAPDVWSDFFRELISISQPSDAFEAIDNILAGPQALRFFLPGKPIPWFIGSLVYHYERLDRLNEQSLGFPIGSDRMLESLAHAIETKLCDGQQLEGWPLGRLNRPYWVTNEAFTAVEESDVVRNKLGLRGINQPGYRLVEIRYSSSYLNSRSIPIKAPTVLDAWKDGARRSWIFTKTGGHSSNAEPGRTIDLSQPDGGRGVPEAVHAPLIVRKGEGSWFALRVLRPITEPPPELSLVGLFRNESI
jgi:hypothetical protein